MLKRPLISALSAAENGIARLNCAAMSIVDVDTSRWHGSTGDPGVLMMESSVNKDAQSRARQAGRQAPMLPRGRSAFSNGGGMRDGAPICHVLLTAETSVPVECLKNLPNRRPKRRRGVRVTKDQDPACQQTDAIRPHAQKQTRRRCVPGMLAKKHGLVSAQSLVAALTAPHDEPSGR